VLIAWNVAMFASAAVNVAEPRLAFRAFDAGTFGLGLMMGSAGIGLAFGAYLAGQWIERRGLANVYGISLGLMAIGFGLAAASPNVWIAAACVVISGVGNGAAVVCNALLVQRGAPDALRGRAFAVLMSSNVAMLTLGIIVAGRLTDVYGPRWVWGAAAIASAVSAVVGFLLARAAGAGSRSQDQPLTVTARGTEPGQQASL
jgi:MFS family permease